MGVKIQIIYSRLKQHVVAALSMTNWCRSNSYVYWSWLRHAPFTIRMWK